MGANNLVWRRLLSFFPEVVKGNSGAAPAVNWVAGSVQSVTLNAATVTPTFTAPPAGANLALVLTQDGVGGRAVAWPAAVSWLGGTPPILLSGAGQTTLVYFYFDGTTYWGSLASGASPSSIVPWTDVAAGTALAASLSRPNLAADSSAAQSTITLPTAAQMAAADGFQFTIKATGAMLSPVIVTAGAGTTIELLNVPGTFGASTWLPIQGQSVVFKYERSSTTWKAASGEVSGVPGEASFNPGWYAQTAIAWDPANATGAAVDSNSGIGAAPLLTFREIVRRYGANRPKFSYGASVQINQGTVAHPSAQPAGQDEIFFEPYVSGGGQAILLVALASAGVDFAAGALGGGYGYAAAVPSAGGTAMTMAAVPIYVVKNVLLENTARASYAFVDAVNAGTATLSQPQTKASILTTTPATPVPVADNDWIAGDNIKAWICQSVNLGRWSPVGNDVTAGNQPCAGWVIQARIVDTSTSGKSTYVLDGNTGNNVLSSCQVDTALQVEGRAGRTWVIGCQCNGTPTLEGINQNVYGGSMTGFTAYASSWIVSNNTILHGASLLGGINGGLKNVFSDGTLICLSPFFASLGKVYGSYAATCEPGCTWFNSTGSTWVLQALLTNGAIKLGSQTTGTSYTPGTGLWASAIALTPANIDANNGLQQPISGARFSNAL